MTERSSVKDEARRVVEGGEADRQSQSRQGDNRTPDKTIGEVKYAGGQGVVPRDQRGQAQSLEQPADKKRAQQSQTEGPAAYAPHQEAEDIRANPGLDPAKKKTGEF
jgi:hypothetical protein